ncbi:MAG: DUF481 domain-containing protein, partial [Allopontixanthobacter sp.]|nr:DUF481 domain-containing protein [Allopontixanthobacter sp.]
MNYRATSFAAAAALLCTHQVAMADLPPPVQAMIDAAKATGDPKKVATVIELAKATNPEAIAEIDQIDGEYASLRAELVV